MSKKLITLSKLTGSDGAIKITMDKVTFQENEDHSLQFVHPEFAPWLSDQIFIWEKTLAIKQGLFRKKYYCSGCGAELDTSLRASVEASYQLEFSDYPPFSLNILMPGVICPQCQKACGIDLDNSFDYQITEALINIFKSANIKF